VEIRCLFDGLSILKVDADYLRNAPSRPFELIQHGNQVYALNGNGWTGFVLGVENVWFKEFDNTLRSLRRGHFKLVGHDKSFLADQGNSAVEERCAGVLVTN
jgi:hypothetical protein